MRSLFRDDSDHLRARELAAQLKRDPAKLAAKALELYRSGWTVREALGEVAA